MSPVTEVLITWPAGNPVAFVKAMDAGVPNASPLAKVAPEVPVDNTAPPALSCISRLPSAAGLIIIFAIVHYPLGLSVFTLLTALYHSPVLSPLPEVISWYSKSNCSASSGYSAFLFLEYSSASDNA